MAGFKFQSNKFEIEVEDKKYVSNLGMIDIADKFQGIVDIVEEYEEAKKGNEPTNFREQTEKITGIIGKFVDDIFGESSFKNMTDGMEIDMEMALDLFAYITEEFNKQKIQSISKYSPNRAKRRSKK